MYEVCMSADSRKVPIVDQNFTDPMNQVQNQQAYEALAFEEDRTSFSSIAFKSGMVVLLALSAYGGYHFLKESMAPTQQVSKLKPTYDWSGRPTKITGDKEFTTLETQDKNVRKIDLTKTASVKNAKKNKATDQLASIIKPVVAKPVVTTRITPQSEGVAAKPTAQPISPDAQSYIVQPGDTLSSIGRAYKISANSIIEINSIENPRLIKPGMKLFVSR